MQACIQCLSNNGYEFIGFDDPTHAQFRKLIDGNEFILLLIGFYEDNHFKYTLRGDFLETHNKWSNADYQRTFKSLNDFLQNWNRFWLFEESED